jgi:hypothetical protein
MVHACLIPSESGLDMLPNGARIAIWRTIAVIGRHDLLPCSVHDALTADAPRLEYTSVFEEYPVLGGTLRSVIAAITAPGGTVGAVLMYQHATSSAPALLASADHTDDQSSEFCAVNVGGDITVRPLHPSRLMVKTTAHLPGRRAFLVRHGEFARCQWRSDLSRYQML